MALLFFVATSQVQAQRAWSVDLNPVQEVQADPEHYYAIQEGYSSVGWSKSGFMNSKDRDVSMELDHSCIYHFVQVGEKEVDGQIFPTYILKNIENNLYLTDGSERYTNKRSRAFEFTIRAAKEKKPQSTNEWIKYSNAVHADECKGAEDAGCVVMCSPTKALYISMTANPGFGTFTNTNNWFIFEAYENKISEYERFCLVFNEYFTEPITPESYPVGDTPGCISQEYFDNLIALYNESLTIFQNSELTDEEYKQAREKIVAVWSEYQNQVVKLKEGYYVIRSDRNTSLLIERYSYWMAELRVEDIPTVWNTNNARYIWQLIEDKENKGRFFIRNFSKGSYVASSRGSMFPLKDEPKTSFLIKPKKGNLFLMHDGNYYASNNSNGLMICNNNTEDPGNWFKFYEVKRSAIDSLNAMQEQKAMNEKLAALVKSVSLNSHSLRLKSGLTEDGYYGPGSAGLVSNFETNAPSEYPTGKAFDGYYSSFFHTNYNKDQEGLENDYHWVQMDFGKKVSEIVMKFSDREDVSNVHSPKVVAFVAAPEDSKLELTEVWTDTVANNYTIQPQYATPYGSGVVDSTTFIGKVSFGKPVQHVRMVVKETNAMYHWPLGGRGVCVTMSEFRVYDAAECVTNPRYEMIPQEVRDALEAELKASREAVKNRVATQELYDALESAYNKFLAAYPDPQKVKDLVAYAQGRVDDADESLEEVGYFKEGAKASLQAIIDEVKAELDTEKMLYPADLEVLSQKLKAGLDAFYKMLIVPEAGRIYFIKEASEMVEQNERIPGSYLHSVNADVNSTPHWNYNTEEDITSRWDAMWIIEKNEEGKVALKNLVSGLYMGNPFEGLTEEEQDKVVLPAEVGFSATPKYFTFKPGPLPRSLSLDMAEDRYVYCSPYGKTGVWYDPRGVHASFHFVNVSETDYNQSFFINFPAHSVNILTLPISVIGVYNSAGVAAYKVLGRKADKIILDAYAEEEEIPAGTPFIVITGEEENFVEVVPNVSEFDELFTLNYNRKPKIQNGLVSAPQYIEPGEGYGILANKFVELSVKGDAIAASTGFFNKDIPETTEEGTFQLFLDGELDGVGTAIDMEQMVVRKHMPTHVYNVAGALIRSNVKSSEAVKGLSKGIYIVNGKKVIVK